MTFSEDRVKGPFSESEAEKIFVDAHGNWGKGNRSERYENLKDTIFEQIPGQWWIAYNEENIPVASQGIGEFEGVYLLLGLHSQQTGYGQNIAEYVVSRHSDKPILGAAATSGGNRIFGNLGFRQVKFSNNRIQREDDLPTEVKSALEIAQERGGTSIRKLFYRPVASWWVMLSR